MGTWGREISSAIDVHFFTSGNGAAAFTSFVHRQSGRSFAARFENAIETVAQLGYDEVVAIGRDCPGLRGRDIDQAFQELRSRKLVVGPDHRGGCYLIAVRSADRALLRDIRWKRNTDCAQLRQRCGENDVFLLPVKQDLDSWCDLRLLARADGALARLAAYLLARVSISGNWISEFVSAASRHIRISQQMPPPAFVA